MLKRLLVQQELELELLPEATPALEFATHTLQRRYILGFSAPQTQAEMLFPDRQDYSIDGIIILLAEFARDELDQRVDPGATALFLHVLLDGQRDHPLASLAILGVFPLGLDALLEEHIVSVGHYLFHRVDVVVHFPEVLDGVETVDLVQDVLVVPPPLPLLLLLVVGECVNVPECPPGRIRELEFEIGDN